MAKLEKELLADSESDPDELFSISRQKSGLEDENDMEDSHSSDNDGSYEGSEDNVESPNNFVMDRVIKVDGSDLPFEKLNKVAGEKLIEVGKTNVVKSRVTTFAQLGISDWLLSNIESKLHWTIPTHVQQMAIPSLLSGRDVQIASPTGSGKTAAFLVPILQLVIIEKSQESTKKQKTTHSKPSSKSKAAGTPSSSSTAEAMLPAEAKHHPVIFPSNVVVAPTLELATQIFHQALLLCDCEEAKSVSVELLSKSQIHKRIESIKAQSTAPTSDNNNNNNKSSSKGNISHPEDNQVTFSDTIDLIVSTPSRIIQLVEEGSIDLSRVHHLVLDEVDRLMTDEMLGQADAIISASKDSKTRRIAFFSATIMPSVEALAASVLQHPIRARIGMKNTAADHVKQHLVYTGSEEGKLLSLQRLLTSGQVRAPVLIFMQSKYRTGQLLQGLGTSSQQPDSSLNGGLSSLGFTVDFITGDRTESQRRDALLSFRSGETTVLVTTDLLARGLDFKAVATVINFDMPTSATTYIHRIGRTGRVGGVTGEAWTLFTDADVEHIAAIANVMVRSGQIENVPEWVLNKPHTKSQTGRRAVVQREDVGGNHPVSSVSTHRPVKHKFFNPSKKVEAQKLEKRSNHNQGKDGSKKRKSSTSLHGVPSPPRKISKKHQ